MVHSHEGISWLARLLPAVSLSRVAGAERHSGLPLALACSLSRQNINYLHNLAFVGEVQQHPLGRFKPAVAARGIAALEDCALFIVDAGRPRPEWGSQWFFIPGWLNGEISLPLADSVWRSQSVRSDLRRVRRQNFEFEVTRDAGKFRDYHRHMHVPFIRQTHGAAAYFDPLAEWRPRFTKHDLLLVRRQGENGPAIAGGLILYERHGPRFCTLGVRDGDPAHVHAGVIAALYHFVFRHVAAQGFSRVSIGRSKPFLHDGLVRYKRKYSNTITGGCWSWYAPGFALKILSFTPAAKSFLQQNPFAFEVEGNLRVAAFTDATRPLPQEIIREFAAEYLHPGLNTLVIHCFQSLKAASPDQIPAELAGKIFVRDAGELL